MSYYQMPPTRLNGWRGETSALYDNLKWAREVTKVLENGLESTIQQLQTYQRELNPFCPIPGCQGRCAKNLDADLSLSGAATQQR